jgi:hypothetical protein
MVRRKQKPYIPNSGLTGSDYFGLTLGLCFFIKHITQAKTEEGYEEKLCEYMHKITEEKDFFLQLQNSTEVNDVM